ncbi:divalent-cation tolerance protein CutA [Candidatus Anaplasma sp. TIGMIC]|uniref:divalent-cation tolerance protein CutA n=1 Tax=Candidatus Anaplasma sp. TIGMIC TaxID=3020713 RepID=UPI00232F057B|nr:divalent-cation tolerance protein CutA [Candidatus Anaplasma sp. TIGMIC]MDB1135793.1 divalent-cation tolerance protein CutA [Candidatus Anaplasma sp. TIGMIC]
MSCDPCIIYVTMPDHDTACKISSELLNHRLISCANTFSNVTSMYLWNGELNTDTECVTIMKTLTHLCERAMQKIQELHPYDVPAVFSIPVKDCSQAFLDWMSSSLVDETRSS